MEKQEFIVLQIFRGIDMFDRLIRCLKGWGTGIVIMSFPVLFFYGEFYFGNQFWKMVMTLFFVLFPVVLLFENIFFHYFRFLKGSQFIVLAILFILSEVEFFYLPWKYSQVEYSGNWIANLTFWIFAIIAAFVVVQFLIPKKKLIIVQKEIL